MHKSKSFKCLPGHALLSPTSVTDIPSDVNFELGQTCEAIEHSKKIGSEEYSPAITITMLAALNRQRMSILHERAYPSRHALCFFSSSKNVRHHTQTSELYPDASASAQKF